MTILETSQDLVKDVLDRGDELTDGSSDFDDSALKYLNRAYRMLWMGGNEFISNSNPDWFWLRATGIITLQPAIEALTISVTNNSASFELSATPSVTVQDYFLKISDHPDVFQVGVHDGLGATGQLDSVWTGTTATAAECTLLPLQYSLATGVIRLLDPMKTDRDGKKDINGMDLDELESSYPLNGIVKGVPTAFGMVDTNEVRFNTYQDELVRIRYTYLQRPVDLVNSATQTPAVPLHYRYVLADMALYFLYGDKEDQRQEGTGQQARAGIEAMTNENRSKFVKSGEMGEISPRPTHSRHGVLRTEQGFIIG